MRECSSHRDPYRDHRRTPAWEAPPPPRGLLDVIAVVATILVLVTASVVLWR